MNSVETGLPEAALIAYTRDLIERPLTWATRERLAQALLDWLTAGWSALDLPAAPRLRDLAATLHPGTGPAPVFGGPPLTPMAAAWANAGISHLREIDDAHRDAMLHPGVVVQRQVAQAMIAGYEIVLRLGESMGAGHAGRFHATATVGSVGAAAAAAVALGLDPGPFHHALGIAATQAAGLWQFADDGAHDAKALHPAFAVRNGMSAALAARAGFPGAVAFITGPRALRALLAGDGPLSSLMAPADALAGPVERLHTTTIKAWPACAMLFTPLDATLALIEQHGLRADDVAAVDVEIFSHALKIAGVSLLLGIAVALGVPALPAGHLADPRAAGRQRHRGARPGVAGARVPGAAHLGARERVLPAGLSGQATESGEHHAGLGRGAECLPRTAPWRPRRPVHLAGIAGPHACLRAGDGRRAGRGAGALVRATAGAGTRRPADALSRRPARRQSGLLRLSRGYPV